MMNQVQNLLDIYRKNPCRTLPNAFWKTAASGEALRVDTNRGSDGELTALAVWHNARLMAFWCAAPAQNPLSDRELSDVQFALVHENALPIFEERSFLHREPYFRLIHQGGIPDYVCPPQYEYVDVVPEQEIDAVVTLIQACYRNIHVDEDVVRSWMAHPTYSPDLWVWVREVDTGQPVGLGIAELDESVPEASLEWVQVLPRKQRRGLGKAITTELLRRVAGKVTFTTVSGQVNNRNRPATLYRRCGFSGDEIWWFLHN
jgi:ribosomal protein S18 acetylase RimI-like enzyme